MASEIPLLQPDSSDLSTTISQQKVQNLPNPGGDITYPVNPTQGVIMNTQGGDGNAEAFGLPATSNNFTINGAEENDPFLNLNNSGPSNLLLGANDVDEVSVVANAYGAQYGSLGRHSGKHPHPFRNQRLPWKCAYYWTNSDLNANQWFNDLRLRRRPTQTPTRGASDLAVPLSRTRCSSS